MNSAPTLNYTIKVRDNSRSIRLQVSLQNGMEVSVPKGTSRRRIERVLKQNQEWIVDSLSQLPTRLDRVAPQQIKLPAIGKRWSGQNPRNVAIMAQMLSENNPNLKKVFPQHHRLDPPEGRSPADLGKAMADLGLKAELIDPQPGVVYTLSK